jgi:hypothetical protein
MGATVAVGDSLTRLQAIAALLPNFAPSAIILPSSSEKPIQLSAVMGG